MSLELHAVYFRGAAANGGALALRRNARDEIVVPEIRAGQPPGHVAAACYTLAGIASGGIPVRVHLRRRLPESDRVQVRALSHPFVDGTVEWWPWSIVPAIAWPSAAAFGYWAAMYAYLARLRASAPASRGGEIRAREVVFSGDADTVETFTVDATGLQGRGVGAHRFRWRWQFRRGPSEGWTDFAFTRQTLYIVLGPPTLPWRLDASAPSNTQLPWVEVLDVACRWAAGALTIEDAAARVTEAVYALGRSGILAYDCAGPDVFSLGTPHYTVVPRFFDCTQFLNRLRGQLGNGPFVNCSDCAAIVATFANILGCDLSQSRMFGVVPFPVNPTLGIGLNQWLAACTLGAFTMHEVAWTGECGAQDDVYDACLAIDADADPTRPPHTPRLPVRMRFGEPGAGYRQRLVAPAGQAACSPQPSTRQRRFVL